MADTCIVATFDTCAHVAAPDQGEQSLGAMALRWLGKALPSDYFKLNAGYSEEAKLIPWSAPRPTSVRKHPDTRPNPFAWRLGGFKVDGTRTSGPVRLALEVADSAGTARELTDAGGELVGGPVDTPWRHRNVRVRAPDGMQLTLFTPLDP